MELERWQALGNEYLIVERERLRFELNAEKVKLLCDEREGLGADGVLELSHDDDDAVSADLTIWNADGSQAELSGNGSRQAIGRATTASSQYPGGPADGRGEFDFDGVTVQYQFVSVGNPQCAFELQSPELLDGLDLGRLGPQVENDPRFPDRTNVSWWAPVGEGRIRARIFERGVGETASSGTGASGAAVASVLAGGSSPVTVVLDGGELVVEIDDAMSIELSGTASCAEKIRVGPDLLERLTAA